MAEPVQDGKLREGELFNTIRKPNATTAVSPGFGVWNTADASRPAWVELELYVETDGTTDGLIEVDIDESGGTTADYTFTFRTASALGAVGIEHSHKFYVPPGASYQIRNAQDPSGVNAINFARQVTA